MRNVAATSIPVLGEATAHLRREELWRAIEGDLSSADLRLRLLGHLGGACEVCEERVRALGEIWPPSLDPAAVSVRDPLLGALLRKLQVVGHGLEAGALRPVHEFWARGHGHPCAFLRLMLEEGRHVSLEGRVKNGVELVEVELADLERWIQAEPLGLSRGAVSDLLGVGRVHLADELIHRGELAEASEQCRRADEQLTRGTTASVLRSVSDPLGDLDREVWRFRKLGNEGLEILATRQEVESELALARNMPWRALEALKIAERMLVFCTIPGRLAETRVRRASVLLQLDHSREARDLLLDVQSETRISGHARLVLEGIHQLAAAEIQELRYAEARALLEANEALYLRSGSDWMLAQREWMLGLVALNLQGLGELAAQHLLQASHELWRLGSEDEAFQVLDPLIRIYLEQRDAARLERLSPQIERLLGSDRWRLPMEHSLRRYLQRAEELGLELPSLRVLLGWELPTDAVN